MKFMVLGMTGLGIYGDSFFFFFFWGGDSFIGSELIICMTVFVILFVDLACVLAHIPVYRKFGLLT